MPPSNYLPQPNLTTFPAMYQPDGTPIWPAGFTADSYLNTIIQHDFTQSGSHLPQLIGINPQDMPADFNFASVNLGGMLS
jgi:hypothetical protein